MSESPRQIGPVESSRFREFVVAGLRAKQLLPGSTIAVEEVRRGLISFTQLALSQTHQSTTKDIGEAISITASEHDASTSFNAGEEP